MTSSITSLFNVFVRENYDTLQELYECYMANTQMDIGFLLFCETLFYKH